MQSSNNPGKNDSNPNIADQDSTSMQIDSQANGLSHSSNTVLTQASPFSTSQINYFLPNTLTNTDPFNQATTQQTYPYKQSSNIFANVERKKNQNKKRNGKTSHARSSLLNQVNQQAKVEFNQMNFLRNRLIQIHDDQFCPIIDKLNAIIGTLYNHPLFQATTEGQGLQASFFGENEFLSNYPSVINDLTANIKESIANSEQFTNPRQIITELNEFIESCERMTQVTIDLFERCQLIINLLDKMLISSNCIRQATSEEQKLIIVNRYDKQHSALMDLISYFQKLNQVFYTEPDSNDNNENNQLNSGDNFKGLL